MVEKKASDLFLKVGAPPSLRVDGQVELVDDAPSTAEFMTQALNEISNEKERTHFAEERELDTAHETGGERFRVSVFKQRSHVGFVFRHVPSAIYTFKELHLPEEQLARLSTLERGLVLMTGTTGSGKSTALAAMVKYMNDNFCRHIITVEDPIEYLHKDNKSIIDQREIGVDTKDFATALKHSLRQSPDVILVGEMRDKETMETALSAAETGHLVISTLHTINAMQTVERIINFFPPHQHHLIRLQLSMTLEGVVSLRLLALENGGRVPAVEILTATPTIKNLLAEGKTNELYVALKDGSDYFGTCTFNQSLKQLVERNVVTIEQALAAADNPDELKLEFRGLRKGSRSSDFEFDTFKRNKSDDKSAKKFTVQR